MQFNCKSWDLNYANVPHGTSFALTSTTVETVHRLNTEMYSMLYWLASLQFFSFADVSERCNRMQCFKYIFLWNCEKRGQNKLLQVACCDLHCTSLPVYRLTWLTSRFSLSLKTLKTSEMDTTNARTWCALLTTACARISEDTDNAGEKCTDYKALFAVLRSTGLLINYPTTIWELVFKNLWKSVGE